MSLSGAEPKPAGQAGPLSGLHLHLQRYRGQRVRPLPALPLREGQTRFDVILLHFMPGLDEEVLEHSRLCVLIVQQGRCWLRNASQSVTIAAAAEALIAGQEMTVQPDEAIHIGLFEFRLEARAEAKALQRSAPPDASFDLTDLSKLSDEAFSLGTLSDDAALTVAAMPVAPLEVDAPKPDDASVWSDTSAEQEERAVLDALHARYLKVVRDPRLLDEEDVFSNAHLRDSGPAQDLDLDRLMQEASKVGSLYDLLEPAETPRVLFRQLQREGILDVPGIAMPQVNDLPEILRPETSPGILSLFAPGRISGAHGLNAMETDPFFATGDIVTRFALGKGQDNLSGSAAQGTAGWPVGVSDWPGEGTSGQPLPELTRREHHQMSLDSAMRSDDFAAQKPVQRRLDADSRSSRSEREPAVREPLNANKTPPPDQEPRP